MTGLSDSDVVLYPAGGEPPQSTGATYIKMSLNDDEARAIIAQFMAMIEDVEDARGRSLLNCFANDYFSYSLAPAAAAIASVSAEALRHPEAAIIVVATKTRSDALPMLGVRTLESRRGSAALLHARYARAVLAACPPERTRSIELRGDWMHFEFLRRTAFSCAGRVMTFLWVARTLLLGFVVKRPRPDDRERLRKLAVVRVEHQARFAERIAMGQSGIGVTLLPQASSGSLAKLVSIARRMVSQGLRLVNPTPTMLGRAWFRTRRDLAALSVIAKSAEPRSIAVSGSSLPLSLADLARDIRFAAVVFVYRETLRQLLQAWSVDVVSFELVGRFAALDAQAARDAERQSIGIQTALIQPRPLPRFPQTDLFLADSSATAAAVSQIGWHRAGVVEYAGPPFSMGSLPSLDRFRSLVYFTQPYEPAINVAILMTLIDWARRQSARVTLRLHPRDAPDRYEAILRAHSDIVSLERNTGVSASILAHDLVVTRTSSAAKEALALGRPIILCLWSAVDRSVEADYVVREAGRSYCSRDQATLAALLCDVDRINADAKWLREHLFGTAQSEDLQRRLLQ